MSSNRARILLIEDDPEITELIRINVSDLNMEIDTAADGKTGLDMALRNNYDLLVLDLMLPELDGLDVCKRIRSEDEDLAILMLTAKSEEFDKVLGLELGADDYLTKPFGIKEFIARIKALLRRKKRGSESDDAETTHDIQIGPLFIQPLKRKVFYGENPVDLTAKEFELLFLFAQNPGRAFTREELLNKVWGYQYTGYEHTVNSHINRLRSKIEEDPSNPVMLRTVWGVGYRFAEQEELNDEKAS